MSYCKNCTRKHLAQAQVLFNEARLGYPVHLWLAVGHLAEAEREIMDWSMEVAESIRSVRLEVINLRTDYPLNTLILIEMVTDDNQ